LYISKRFNLLRAAAFPTATWPNNGAEANGSQELKLEKVKNLYRTATTEKIVPTLQTPRSFTPAR
jgi:hypothetical protein